jgi:hypothetical protein
MRNKRRRLFLRACVVSGIGLLAGCTGGDGSGESSPTSSTDTPSSTPSPEDLLPEEGDGWTRDQVEHGAFSWSARGATDGVFGSYTSPENRSYEVVVMEMQPEYSPERKAITWNCTVGWSVALAYRQFAIAASTGTAQETFTPEQPPHLTRTPIPGTAESAKALLSNSSALSREYIDSYAISDADC